MRIWKIVCALATTAGVTWAQQTGSPTATRPASRASAAYPDTLRLTRSEAVAAALANNPQLEVAREQTSQARARRVQAVAIPDPTLVASLDQQPGFLRLGRPARRTSRWTSRCRSRTSSGCTTGSRPPTWSRPTTSSRCCASRWPPMWRVPTTTCCSRDVIGATCSTAARWPTRSSPGRRRGSTPAPWPGSTSSRRGSTWPRPTTT